MPRLSLTDIRGLGISTTQQAKGIADHLVGQQLLESLSDTQFQAPEQLRQRFTATAEMTTEQVTGEVLNQTSRQVPDKYPTSTRQVPPKSPPKSPPRL